MTGQSGTPSEMPAAVALLPLELAVYQDGSVVSRVLLKRSGGTVTLFAFDAGQELSEHTAPFDAVAMINRLVASIDWAQLVGGVIVAALLVYAASEYRRRTLAT